MRRGINEVVHLSDLHFNPLQDGTDTNYLREKIKKFLSREKIQVDKLFFTGDFRDAKRQDDTDENAQKVAQYILEIANRVGIVDSKDILCVPGNHDLNRDINNRPQLIRKTKNAYSSKNGTFEDTSDLVQAFTFYKRVLNQLYGKCADELFEAYKVNPHRMYQYNDCNVMLVNTELVSGEIVTVNDGTQCENDIGTIIVGSNYIFSLLYDVKQTQKPTIVLGHRGLEFFEPTERRKIISMFEDNKVCLYLCGHSHDLWCEKQGDIRQITVGCISEDSGVKTGFEIGEVCSVDNTVKITAYTWDNNNWSDYTHFTKDGSTLSYDFSQNTLLHGEKFPLTIKIVIDGRICQFSCQVPKNQIIFGEEHLGAISVVTGDLTCIVCNNEYSDSIKEHNRFVLSKAIWKVIGMDTTTHGVYKYDLTYDEKSYYDFSVRTRNDVHFGVRSM